jgi:hypothetical protein
MVRMDAPDATSRSCSTECAVSTHRDVLWGFGRRVLWAVKGISRSQWNDAFPADSGPSRGDPRRGAFRPSETFVAPPADYRPRP